MEYLNQLAYPDLPYPTNADAKDERFYENGTVKIAGCGLCSACMLVEQLTLAHFSIEECRDFAMEIHANHGVGTDMKLLAPALAERFGLAYRPSSDLDELRRCLQEGGRAIANVGGDREGYEGTFSNGGHYIFVMSAAQDEFCILDPSLKEDKYTAEPRRSRVRRSGNWLYCSGAVLAKDTANRTPSYYLFHRKSDAPAHGGSTVE